MTEEELKIENQKINERMIVYKENVNLVARINVELTKKLGLEHYLTEFSSNLIRALNQYERFVFLLNNKLEFVESIIVFSDKCVDFFNMTPPELVEGSIFKKRKVLKKNYNENMAKINRLVESMNKINETIDKTIGESVKKYFESDITENKDSEDK
jgi:hypothetical protein